MDRQMDRPTHKTKKTDRLTIIQPNSSRNRSTKSDSKYMNNNTFLEQKLPKHAKIRTEENLDKSASDSTA